MRLQTVCNPIVTCLVACCAALVWTSPLEAVTCPNASPFDDVADDAALQACLDAGGYIELQPGEPGYIIRHGLRMVHDNTTLTTTAWGQWVHLRAHVDLDGRMLAMRNDQFLSGWELSYIWLDGSGRSRSLREAACNEDYRHRGINATLKGSGFNIRYSLFTDAMCGSGLELSGSNFEVYSNYFANNGRPREESAAGQPWADGLTLHSCNYGSVRNNFFENNTDVDIIVGTGSGCQVRFNTILHSSVYGYAGINIGGGNVNQIGGSISNNEIMSAPDKLGYGLSVGCWPWAQVVTPNVGEVADNRITGAVVNLVVDHIDGGIVTGNVLQYPTGTRLACPVNGQYTAASWGNAQIQPGFVLYTHNPCGLWP